MFTRSLKSSDADVYLTNTLTIINVEYINLLNFQDLFHWFPPDFYNHRQYNRNKYCEIDMLYHICIV